MRVTRLALLLGLTITLAVAAELAAQPPRGQRQRGGTPADAGDQTPAPRVLRPTVFAISGARVMTEPGQVLPKATVVIRDDTYVRLERVSFAIKGEEFFSVPGEPDVDVASQFIGIKRVGRLAELEHHEIGNVDDIIDRANTDALDFGAQPLRTGADMDSLDPARGKERTLVVRGNCYARFPDGNFHFVRR